MAYIDKEKILNKIQKLNIRQKDEYGEGYRDCLSYIKFTISTFPSSDSPGWISVKDRLPKKNGEYLTVKLEKGFREYYDLCHWNGYFKTFTLSGTAGDACLRHPTHWMPLPEPPKPE